MLLLSGAQRALSQKPCVSQMTNSANDSNDRIIVAMDLGGTRPLDHCSTAQPLPQCACLLARLTKLASLRSKRTPPRGWGQRGGQGWSRFIWNSIQLWCLWHCLTKRIYNILYHYIYLQGIYKYLHAAMHCKFPKRGPKEKIAVS